MAAVSEKFRFSPHDPINEARRRPVATFLGEFMHLRSAVAILCLASATPALGQDGDYAQADAELNRLYQKIESRLSHNHAARQKLVSAQRAWIAFRDAECTFASSAVEGGSVYKDVYEACLQDLTQARIASFNTYLECAEGDLACPVPAN